MRRQTRNWIMPEVDMVAMLGLIDEKICSTEIETRHHDTLIRLREILESDLTAHLSDGLPVECQTVASETSRTVLANPIRAI
jgi:hypothetical protein